MNCARCGQEFETTVWIRADSSEVSPDDLCGECRQLKEQEDFIIQQKEKLKDEKKRMKQHWLEEYGVTGIFTEKTFENFKRELQPRAFDAVKGIESKSLVLLSSGVYGLGKTHLICALANHLIGTKEPATFMRDSYYIGYRRCPVHFTTEAKLLARIRQTYNRNDDEAETEEDVFEQLHRFPLVIIDDVGKVRPRDYSFLQGVYFRIIDDRYVEEKPIILTTNLDLKELEEHIGGACADRLREMCGKAGFILMKGQSYRSRK